MSDGSCRCQRSWRILLKPTSEQVSEMSELRTLFSTVNGAPG
jgi:hypothetical protein